MTDEGPPTSQFERWVRSSATIIAPATVLSALLFYFGYVSARSRYEYFGVDVDTIGLGTQDYIMRSPQPLLVPLLVLTFVGIGSLTLHTATRRRIETAATGMGDDKNGAASTRQINRIRRLARGSVITGLVVLGIGIVLLFIYALVRDWALYNLVTPLLIALGAALIAYGSRVLELVRRLLAQRPALLRRTSSVLIYVVIAACTFGRPPLSPNGPAADWRSTRH